MKYPYSVKIDEYGNDNCPFNHWADYYHRYVRGTAIVDPTDFTARYPKHPGISEAFAIESGGLVRSVTKDYANWIVLIRNETEELLWSDFVLKWSK